MRKIKIIGLKSERSLILNALERSGCFEVVPTTEQETGEKVRDSSRLEYYLARQSRAAFAVNFLEQINSEASDNIQADVKKAKKKKFKDHNVRSYGFEPVKKKNGRAIVGYDDFYDIAAKEYELLNICDQLQEINFKRLELKSANVKLAAMNRNLKPYEHVDVKFSDFKDTKTAAALLALGPPAALLPDFGPDVYTETYPCQTGVIAALITKIETRQSVAEKLFASGFSLCPYSYDDTAKNIIEKNEAEIEANRTAEEGCISTALSYTKYLGELKAVYDIFGLETEKARYELEFVKTNSTFLLEGWTAEQYCDIITEKLKSKTKNIFIEVSLPDEGDEPPTLIKNKRIFRPFEDTTNMYSVPSYGEVDPNPFMAVFFFIFFGIMLGDAGYGLVLSLGCFIILRLFKFEKGMKNMVAMFGICGISAVVWGLLFGGVFAIESVPAIWFNPMSEPILMLVVSLVLGVLQLAAGYGLNAYKKIRSGKIADGILDNIFIYFIFSGVACLALGAVLTPSNAVLSQVGMILLIVALAGILLTNGRHAKGIGGKIAGGLVGIYNLINLFSDVLSYARIFGLALASGAIGLAFNQLGSMIFSIPVIGYVAGGALLIVLHAFNMGLSLLSTYVHNIRLQYLEFYGKFYDGGGRLFSPMGENTKYVRFR